MFGLVASAALTAEIDERMPFREHVARSLLTMRLLTYSPSGAPVAAPTTSLPEDIGGQRNWGYRYVWPRDASIGVSAFLSVGKADEAQGFLAWLLHASRLQRPRLPALLTLHGRHVPAEREVPGWPGYLWLVQALARTGRRRARPGRARHPRRLRWRSRVRLRGSCSASAPGTP